MWSPSFFGVVVGGFAVGSHAVVFGLGAFGISMVGDELLRDVLGLIGIDARNLVDEV